MTIKKRAEVREAIKLLVKGLERWREEHKGRQVRIPEKFWCKAVKAARVHGVSSVATVLNLDYGKLRELSGIKKIRKGGRKGQETPAFIEMCRPGNFTGGSQAIEIQGSAGGRIRLEFQDAPGRELLRLTERLWRMAR